MDEIREVINKVVRGCGKCGLEIDDVLAAFVARTIVESNESMFALDRKMTAANTEEIVLQAIERLIERDNPSLETMKMQVDYDTSFIKHDSESQKTLRVRNKMIANHKMTIVEVIMEDANDFEALTVLYRKIFRFLLDFAPNSKGQDRQVEREVAAALESVFPRIGLKAFVLLSYEEKSSQLSELARIVLGIRLFNRDQNRGGAGIDQMDKEGSQLAMTMLDDVNNEVSYFSDACNKYQLAIIRAQLIRRKMNIDKESKADAKGSSSSRVKIADSNPPGLVPEKLVDRWLKEMVNRRQYLGFLRTLQDEMMSLQEKVSQICSTFREELVNVQQMVTNKASVSKELVYPKFDALGALWVALYEEVTILLARSNTFGVLCKYRLSFTPTLDEKYYSGLIGIDGYGEAETVGLSLADLEWTTEKGQQSPKKGAESKDGGGREESKSAGGSGMVVAVDGVEIQETTEAGATLMSVHNTPDFLLLPLELQGYCPWTIVHAHGLLLPGKPALGVVRYDNIYYVCQHVQAMKSFMEDPEYYLKQIRLKALTNPEYIHLLRLQRWFPTASIARLLDQDDHDPSSLTGEIYLFKCIS
jgi:hypothetical protein